MDEMLTHRLWRYRDSRKLAAFLATIPSITLIRLLDRNEFVTPESFRREIYRIDAPPSSEIARNTTVEEQEYWVRACYMATGIQDTCYLWLGDYGFAPGAEITIPPSGDWPVTLWSQLVSRHLSIASTDHTRNLVFTEEEYSNCAFIRTPDRGS